MNISRLDLDGAGSPTALVTRIFELEPDLPIPVPVEELCGLLDIVAIKDLTTQGFEAALITDRLKASGAILVAEGRPRQRRRFSIAHELGHFLIPTHLPPREGQFKCKAEDMRTRWSKEQARHQRIEAEANRFAAQLLMPPPLLRTELRKARRPDIADVLRLADYFEVSREALARAYVEQHREALAVVITRHGKVLRAYYPVTRFPWISSSCGDAVPRGSLFHQAAAGRRELSNHEECEPETWLGEREAAAVSSLSEQVFIQRDGFAMILLHADLRDDDDEADADRRASWQPRF